MNKVTTSKREKLYNITKEEAKILLNHCDNNIQKLAAILWNSGRVKTLETGIKRAIKIKNFAHN